MQKISTTSLLVLLVCYLLHVHVHVLLVILPSPFYTESTDAMSRPLSVGSHKRPISWSSQERLKIKDQEKSQFYTPVRNRRKEGDDTLPPLPPSVSRKKPHKTPAMEGGDIPLLPPPVVAPGSPLKVPPPKPPRSDLVLTSTPNAPGKCSVLDSVKMIENILESNSAPDLLSKVILTSI